MQKAVKEKSLKFKQYQQSRCDEDKDDFREASKRAKKEVAKAKESAFKDLLTFHLSSPSPCAGPASIFVIQYF